MQYGWILCALLCRIFICLRVVKIRPHTCAISSNIAFSPIIYYSAWADQRRRMASYMAYRPLTQQHTATAGSILLSQGCIFRPQGVYCWVRGVYFDHREYIAESGVNISTTGSVLLSRGWIFGWVTVQSSRQLRNLKISQLQHIETKIFVVLQILPRPHYESYCQHYIEPLYCTTSTAAKASHKFRVLFVQL